MASVAIRRAEAAPVAARPADRARGRWHRVRVEEPVGADAHGDGGPRRGQAVAGGERGEAGVEPEGRHGFGVAEATDELADRLAETKSISAQLLIQVLRQGEVNLFEALFVKMTQIRLQLARRLLLEEAGEGLAVACKAVGISRSDFANIFTLTRKARGGGVSEADLAARDQSASRSAGDRRTAAGSLKATALSDAAGHAVTRSEDLTQADHDCRLNHEFFSTYRLC